MSQKIESLIKQLQAAVAEENGTLFVNSVIPHKTGFVSQGGHVVDFESLPAIISDDNLNSALRLCAIECIAADLAVKHDDQVSFDVSLGDKSIFGFFTLPETALLRKLITETPDTPAYDDFHNFMRSRANEVNLAGSRRDREALKAILGEAVKIREAIALSKEVSHS